MGEFSKFVRNRPREFLEVAKIKKTEVREIRERGGERPRSGGVEDEVISRNEAGAREINDTAKGITGDAVPGAAVRGGGPGLEKAGWVGGDVAL